MTAHPRADISVEPLIRESEVQSDPTAAMLDLLPTHDSPLHAIVFTLLKLAAYKDYYTSGHLRRVRDSSVGLAAELRRASPYRDQIDDAFIGRLALASTLHDIGKVGVPEAILLKPGRLDPGETREMQAHARLGGALLADAAERLQSNPTLQMAAEIAFGHHEHFDGSGYPSGLAGGAIPLSARIVTVVDVFDALVSARPYKTSWAIADAVAYIAQQAGTKFDPVVAAAFVTWQSGYSRA